MGDIIINHSWLGLALMPTPLYRAPFKTQNTFNFAKSAVDLIVIVFLFVVVFAR